jgi:hypothetical protein
MYEHRAEDKAKPNSATIDLILLVLGSISTAPSGKPDDHFFSTESDRLWPSFHRVIIFPWKGKQGRDKGSNHYHHQSTAMHTPLPPSHQFIFSLYQPNTNTTAPFLSTARKLQLRQAKRPHQHPPFAAQDQSPNGGAAKGPHPHRRH